jgi:predicted nucleic acid-binding protein
VTFGLDTNVLIYALDPAGGEKHRLATDIVTRGVTLDMVLAAQVLGEYLNVARRKMPHRLPTAIELVDTLTVMLPVISTTARHIAHAGRVSGDHHLQYWDALIIGVYGSADVKLLLTEDLQDGQRIDGIEIVNPFKPANASRIVELLGG